MIDRDCVECGARAAEYPDWLTGYLIFWNHCQDCLDIKRERSRL